MRTRMTELQSELEQTIKRIEQIQRGGGGYGARANRVMNFAGGSNGSRNSSLGSNNRSNNSQNRGNRYQNNSNPNRPLPSYMRPKGQNSSDRYGSGQRNISGNRSGSYNRNERYLPRNYQPPHLRGSNNSGTRVSPGRQGPQPNGIRSSGYGQQQNNRISPNRPGQLPGQQSRKSPGSRRYANVQSRLYQPKVQ